LPLYEYRCTACGYEFEKIQSFKSSPQTECPECQGALERPLSAPAFQFKGAGWYVNDYAAKSSGSSSNGGSSKAESTPAADAKPVESAKPAPTATAPSTPPSAAS